MADEVEIDYVKLAFDAISAKRPIYDKLWDYYYGVQPLIYSTDRLRDAFKTVTARFTQNWLSVVVTASLDRLVMKGFDHDKKVVNNALDETWEKQELNIETSNLIEAALVCGEAFLIVDKVEQDIDVYYNDPRLCHVFYDPGRPKVKTFAAKWYADTKSNYMIIFLPNENLYYETGKSDEPSTSKAFNLISRRKREGNGNINVFHFNVKGEIAGLLTLQDAVNKIFADMMISSEFGAYPQRWVISNSNITELKNAPNEIWDIPGGDGEGQQTSVGQFQATQLANYYETIDRIVSSMAIISKTPKYMFYTTGANVSGEALLAMEAPLVKKVEAIQERLSSGFKDVAKQIAALKGFIVEKIEISTVWKIATSSQPFTSAQTRKLDIEAGIPLITTLRREGWANDELLQMKKDKEDAKTENAELASAALEIARIKSDQSNALPVSEKQPE